MAEGTLDITISNQIGTPPVTVSSISALYNWWAVMTGKLLPSGWHAADDTDWDSLVAFAGGDAVAGGKLKQTGTVLWDDPNIGATNEFGLSITGSGVRLNDGQFIHLGLMAWFWVYFEIGGWGREVNFWNDETRMSSNGYFGGVDLRQGFSVRGVKNSTTKTHGQTGIMTDYDGNIYNTICINDREWMTSNLRVSHFNDGSVILNVIPDTEWAALTTEAMCYYGNVTPPPPDPIHGNPPEYEIYISETCSLTYQVFPLNFLSTSLVDEQEDGEVFYRRRFNGSLIFGSNSRVKDYDGNWHDRCDDWALFWGFEQTDPCAKLYIQINKIVNGVVYPYWDGYFSTTDGKFDIDKQLFEITPQINDDYTLALDETKKEYNLIPGVTPKVTIHILGSTTVFTRNMWLMDVIKFLADKIVTGVTVVSSFFTDAINPVTLDNNHLLYLTIAQKSDILRPTSTDPANSAMLSWETLMDILKTMFQVQWDYSSLTNTIRIEHISSFTSVAGIDLRTQALCVATNKYSYLKEKMPKYEKYSFMEADDSNFVGIPIYYDNGCVNQDPKSNITEKNISVTTDLQFILDNPEAIADDGFVILCNYLDSGNYYVESEMGKLYPVSLPNMHLSWANLEDKYFRHNRVLNNGYINNTAVTFFTTQKNKQQTCSAIICDEFDPTKDITTELGEVYLSNAKAKVKTATIHPSGLTDFVLLYGFKDNASPGIPDDKIITISETTGALSSHFYASCNRPADVELTIDIYLTCQDGDGMTCDTATMTITIAAGTQNGTTIVPWCEPVATPAICVKNYHADTTGAPGWTVQWNYDPDSYCP